MRQGLHRRFNSYPPAERATGERSLAAEPPAEPEITDEGVPF